MLSHLCLSILEIISFLLPKLMPDLFLSIISLVSLTVFPLIFFFFKSLIVLYFWFHIYFFSSFAVSAKLLSIWWLYLVSRSLIVANLLSDASVFLCEVVHFLVTRPFILFLAIICLSFSTSYVMFLCLIFTFLSSACTAQF